MYCCPCRVGPAAYSEGGLDIASNSGLEGDGTEAHPWLHVQPVSCDDGRLDWIQHRSVGEEETFVGLPIPHVVLPTDLDYGSVSLKRHVLYSKYLLSLIHI